MRSQFLHEITDKVLQHNIPNERIINIDQTASTFVAKVEKHILHPGATDKRAITVTFFESFGGCMLPFQLIILGKWKDLYQTSLFLMDSA